MGARPGLHLHVHGTTPLHRLSPGPKIAGLFGFALAVVAAPRPGVLTLVASMVIAVGLLATTQVAWALVWPRLLLVVPILVFAALLPLVALGPRVALGPVPVSEAGLVGGWLLFAKATSAILAATAASLTTSGREFVAGLVQLRLPATLVTIVSLMVRYAGVVGDEFGRMLIAQQSRGFRPRSVAGWPTQARSVGTLFVRSIERGERVQVAMLSRGGSGHDALVTAASPPTSHWWWALGPGLAVLLIGIGERAL